MRNALIMGASGDIGTAIAERFAQEGYSLTLHYHKNQEKVLNLLKKLQAKYPKQDFFMVYLDMLNESQFDAFLEQLFSIDIVVFASGFTYYSLVSDLDSLQLEELWQIHLKSPILLCQGLEDKLAMSGHGRILFIGSVYGKTGSAMEAVYSAMKAGQEIFAKSYAKELASRNITVNVLAPGATDTKMNQQFSQEEKENLLDEIPLGRLGNPAEIANAAAFIVDEKSDYMTGATILMDGGWS